MCTTTITICTASFLSTLSLRRATISHFIPSNGTLHFYPRSPCGERPSCRRPCERPTTDFYPRSPCGERPIDKLGKNDSYRFLSTLSLRRATNGYGQYYIRARISIHALLAESDSPLPLDPAVIHNFYPRSPCGERLIKLDRWFRSVRISIHALLAESD